MSAPENLTPVSTPALKPCCALCRFALARRWDTDNPDTFQCRRWPPTNVPGFDPHAGPYFPIVEDTWWCGEYQEKEKPSRF